MKRVALWILVWMGVISMEIMAAAAAAGMTAAIMIPLARAERGYDAVGGEWLVIGGTMILTFYLIHRGVCNKVFGKRNQKERWIE